MSDHFIAVGDVWVDAAAVLSIRDDELVLPHEKRAGLSAVIVWLAGAPSTLRITITKKQLDGWADSPAEWVLAKVHEACERGKVTMNYGRSRIPVDPGCDDPLRHAGMPVEQAIKITEKGAVAMIDGLRRELSAQEAHGNELVRNINARDERIADLTRRELETRREAWSVRERNENQRRIITELRDALAGAEGRNKNQEQTITTLQADLHVARQRGGDTLEGMTLQDAVARIKVLERELAAYRRRFREARKVLTDPTWPHNT